MEQYKSLKEHLYDAQELQPVNEVIELIAAGAIFSYIAAPLLGKVTEGIGNFFSGIGKMFGFGGDKDKDKKDDKDENKKDDKTGDDKTSNQDGQNSDNGGGIMGTIGRMFGLSQAVGNDKDKEAADDFRSILTNSDGTWKKMPLSEDDAKRYNDAIDKHGVKPATEEEMKKTQQTIESTLTQKPELITQATDNDYDQKIAAAEKAQKDEEEKIQNEYKEKIEKETDPDKKKALEKERDDKIAESKKKLEETKANIEKEKKEAHAKAEIAAAEAAQKAEEEKIQNEYKEKIEKETDPDKKKALEKERDDKIAESKKKLEDKKKELTGGSNDTTGGQGGQSGQSGQGSGEPDPGKPEPQKPSPEEKKVQALQKQVNDHKKNVTNIESEVNKMKKQATKLGGDKKKELEKKIHQKETQLAQAKSKLEKAQGALDKAKKDVPQSSGEPKTKEIDGETFTLKDGKWVNKDGETMEIQKIKDKDGKEIQAKIYTGPQGGRYYWPEGAPHDAEHKVYVKESCLHRNDYESLSDWLSWWCISL